MLTLAKRRPVLYPRSGPIPHGLVTLWDMINFSVGDAAHALKCLEDVEEDACRLKHAVASSPDPQNPTLRTGLQRVAVPAYVDQTMIERVSALVVDVKDAFSCLDADTVNDQIKSLEDCLRPDRYFFEWSSLEHEVGSLIKAIENELDRHCFFHYQKQKAKRVRSFEDDWKRVIEAFENVKADALAATDLWALGHDTAAVFHLMRVLEYGLAALAKEVGKTYDRQQWHNIIEEIESGITDIRKTGPKSAEKDERLKFLSEAAKEFFYFKDGWRNYVSHNRVTYDEHQALSTIEHVRRFMEVLSTRLTG